MKSTPMLWLGGWIIIGGVIGMTLDLHFGVNAPVIYWLIGAVTVAIGMLGAEILEQLEKWRKREMEG